MEMRKQGEGQGTARSASKSPVKKQSREQTNPTDQRTTENQEMNRSTAQSTSGMGGMQQDQRRSPQQGRDEHLLQHAKQAGGEIVNQVQQRAGSQINRQKEAAAEQVSQVANSVRRIRETLSQPENGPLARYAADYSDMAANRLEQFSNYIREKDPKQLLDDVQNFGRRRPALLLGGAFLLGFAGARLIKSSMDTTALQRNIATPGGTSYAANE